MSGKSEHTYVNGVCSVCGHEQGAPVSKGLEFTLNEDNSSYSVTGIGTYEESNLVIPAEYNKLPVTSIGEYAFRGCRSLTSVTIGNSVTSIGYSAFNGCTALTTINYNAIECADLSDDNRVFSHAGQSGEGITVNIGVNVKKIPANLFYAGHLDFTPKIVNVVFEENNVCGSIGERAFYNCVSLTSITIPDSVTYIEEEAFASCTSLTSITIPDSVTSIGDSAFHHCSSLTSVTIGNGIISISDSAFYGCTSLTSITIPEGVTSIGNIAFGACDKLIEVYNKSSLIITAGDYENGAVANYAKNVYTPTRGSSRLTMTDDGYIFYNDKANGNGYYLMGYIGTETSLTLPDNFNGSGYSIYQYAFYNCTSLTSITIPDSVMSIGNHAFYNCISLTYKEYGNGYYLGNETNPYFILISAKDTFITSCIINENTKFVCGFAFSECDLLTEVNYNAIECADLSDDNKVFYRAGQSGEGITVNIGANVKKIPANLFNSSTYKFEQPKIVRVEFSENGKCESIGNGAFRRCSGVTSITIPDGVTSISELAFYDCSGLTSITIPDSVTSIGYSAFNGCTALTTINYNAIECADLSGGVGVFSYAGQSGDGITVNIGANVKKIPSYLFYGDYFESYPKIISVVFEKNSVCESIGIWAFVSSVSLPVYITDIAAWCESNYCSISYNYNLYLNGELVTALVIPDSVTSIGDAFSGCTSLTSVTIGDSVTSISNSAFSGCTSLTSVTIGSGVTNIGAYAFYGCSVANVYYKGTLSEYFSLDLSFSSYRLYIWNGEEYAELTTVTILPNQIDFLWNIASIKEITVQYDEDSQINTFYLSGMTWLEKINLEYFEDEVEIYNVPENVQINYGYHCQVGTLDNFGYEIRGNVASLTSYTGTEERIILPTQIEGVAITKLGSIFKNNTMVKEVVIPEGYTEIADEAFYGCTALEIVYIPSTITQMGKNIFYNNNMVYNAPSNLPFANDDSYILSGIYTSLSLNASTGNWTDKAYFIHKNSHFDADSKIIYEYGGGIEESRILRYSGTDSTVTVPATIENIAVKEIYYFAFYGIQTLNSVTLSEGIESIGSSAFEGCSALKTVSLPQSLTAIGGGAFKDCSNLTTITIPREVNIIGDYVFTGCTALTSISFEQPIGWTSYEFTIDGGPNPESEKSHDMSNATECVTILRDTYAERMFFRLSQWNAGL